MNNILISYGKYVTVYDERRKCKIQEHDKVWLDAHGYYNINKMSEYGDGNYVIHHINGNRADNRLENLQLLTRSEHAKLHSDFRDPKINEQISKKLKGVKRSDETKARMSEAQKAHPSRAMLGKHHSDETKQKIRESNKIAWANKPQEEKDRLNENNRQMHLGKPAPNKGVPCPKNQREHLSEYWKKQYESGYVAPSLGRIFVTNGVENHQIKQEELQSYLDRGYRRGFVRRKKKNDIQ